MAVPSLNKESNKMTNRFMGARVTKKVKFMNEEIEISKLTVSQVSQITAMAKALETSQDDGDNVKLLLLVVGLGAKELNDLSEDEIVEFPMDELAQLSNAIMKYSGLGQAAK
jgi:hypothetical protein